jgi:hypothetical protein
MDPAAGSTASMVALGLLALLLVFDLTFVCGHIWLAPFHEKWNIEADNGYAEKLQYLKWLAACILLLALALRRRAAIYLAWAAIFLYFLIDDAMSIHERIGGWLTTELGLDRLQEVYIGWFPGFFLRAQDFGELILALLVAAAIAVLLVLSWPPHAAARERTVMKRLVAWLGLFAFFAVGVDLLHIMTLDPVTWASTPAGEALAVIEDGGEMISASLLVGGLALELARG